jgi:type I restriction enzyme, S subunit
MRLDQVASIIMGQAPAGESYNVIGEGWPLIAGAGDFKDGKLAPVKHTTQAAKLSEPGDIILSIRASIGDKVTADGIYCLGRGVAGIRASQLLSPRYLWHWLTSVEAELSNKGKGATFKQVNRNDIGELRIPMPSLAEQKRIAEILDRADALIAERRRSSMLLDDLGQSIFVEMFGDVVKNERAWPVGTVSSFVKNFESGKSLAEGEDATASPYRILKISAVTSGRFKAYESKPAPEGYEPPKSHFVSGGDLLFSRANTSELIGATAFVPNGVDNLLMPDKLWRFAWNFENKPSPWFVHYLFRQRSVRDVIRRNASGTSGSMKNISQQKVLAIEVGIPPSRVQDEFERRILEVGAALENAESQALVLDELFAALQARAFSGEL